MKEAIAGTTAELKRPYEKAVLHRSVEYEDIVWSTADGEDLFRDLQPMFLSYKRVCRQRQREEVLDKTKYSERVRQLRLAGYGPVLESVAGRPGWYTYKEKMLRGFVRMQAEVSGVKLVGEKDVPKQRVHVPSNVRSGYRGPIVPAGVKLGGDSEAVDDNE